MTTRNGGRKSREQAVHIEGAGEYCFDLSTMRFPMPGANGVSIIA